MPSNPAPRSPQEQARQIRDSIQQYRDHIDTPWWLHDQLETWVKALAALLAADDWQPIESAPKEVTRAILHWPTFKLNEDCEQTDERYDEGLVAEGFRVGGNDWESDIVTEHFEDEAGFGYGAPTHFKLMPSPPQEPQRMKIPSWLRPWERLSVAIQTTWVSCPGCGAGATFTDTNHVRYACPCGSTSEWLFDAPTPLLIRHVPPAVDAASATSTGKPSTRGKAD